MNETETEPDQAPEDAPETPDETIPDVENDPRHLRLLEAVLFASAEPVSERVLANRLPEDADVASLLEELRRSYADRGVNLVRAGKSWAFRTAPDLSQLLNMEIDVPRKLSRAAVETLAIIAYHQPVTRAEIEEVRGVGLSKGTFDTLLEAGWIKLKGRRRTPGRPTTWGITDGFLDHFGLEDVGDLPGMDELKAAGLLDSGPAISLYQATAGDAGLDDSEPGEDGEGFLELIGNNDENGEEAAPEESPDEPPEEPEDDPPDPLDPDGGEAGRG